MATSTDKTTNGKTTIDADTFEAAFDQFKDLNEKVVAATRRAGTAYLDTYEQAVDKAIELEQRLAGASRQDWLKQLIETQADVTRQVTSTYTAAARAFLK